MTERTEHLDAILVALADKVPPPFVLHGRLSKRHRAKLIIELDLLSPDAPRILLATGKLVGALRWSGGLQRLLDPKKLCGTVQFGQPKEPVFHT